MNARRSLFMLGALAAVAAACQLGTGPLALDDSATIAEPGPVIINVLKNDFDAGKLLEVDRIFDEMGGTTEISPDGRIVFTPTPGYTGPMSFRYVATNGAFETEPATVTVHPDFVEPVDSPELTISPSPAELGLVVVNEERRLDVTLANTGTGTLRLTTPRFTSDADGFSVEFDCPATLAEGEACGIAIVFSPRSAGAYLTGLDFGSNILDLRGEAVDPADPEFSRDEIDFGEVLINAEATDQFTVVNPGPGSVELGPAFIEPDSVFSIVENACPPVLVAGSDCRVVVAFTPTSTTESEGRVGFGDWPAVRLVGAGSRTNPGWRPDPTIVEFGAVVIDDIGREVVTVRNDGPGSLSIRRPTISGGSGAFRVDNSDCNATIREGVSCATTVIFEPDQQGDQTATLSFGPGPTVELRGNGQHPGPTADPARIDFISLDIGDSTTGSVTVTNPGPGLIELEAPIISVGASAFGVVSTTCDRELAEGSACVVEVEFRPISAGDKAGTLSIPCPACRAGAEVILRGTAHTRPVVVPDPLVFGDVVVNTPSLRSVTITNPGPDSLFVQPATITSGSSRFSIESDTCGNTTLPAFGDCTIDVGFVPKEVQDYRGVLRVGTLSVDLRGSGIAVDTPLQARPNPLVFGDVTVNTNTTRSVTITNPGPRPIDIEPAVITSSSGLFRIAFDGCGDMTLPADRECDIRVAFAPGETLDYLGELRVNSLLIGLEGTGIPVNTGLEASPNPLVFGNVTVNTTATLSVAIINPGPGSLPVGTASIFGSSGLYTITSNGCGSTLAAATSCEIEVQFAPDETLDYFEELRIGTTLTVDLRGTGVSITALPDLVVVITVRTSVSCSGTPVMCEAEVGYRVTNVGTADADPFLVHIEGDQVGEVFVPFLGGLGAGDTTGTVFSVLGPGGNCYDPNCTVIVTVDWSDAVAESNETNNVDSQTDNG